ncbi:MAG: YbhB/YbcL family Raf kinase inhibitor-like protein [Bacteroidetes bacterium]|nr:YbhB/YbcL family Raf kinase inhibitor-like protein [Bacteroidota bacterium]
MYLAKHAIFLLNVFFMVNCGSAQKQDDTASKNMEDEMSTTTAAKFALASTAFKEGEMIPKKYTCDGPDISPPLEWHSVPPGAKSLALIVEDPDAPMGTWVHWVIFNIPPQSSGLPEHVSAEKTLPDGAIQGRNDFRKIGYGGPCPPGGIHRYFFILYALDTMLRLPAGSAKAELVRAMEGHVIGKAQLMGKYSH